MIRSKITVLIPVKDDPKTIKCVASIDAEAHIVIVFNGAKQDFVHSIKAVSYTHLDVYKRQWHT